MLTFRVAKFKEKKVVENKKMIANNSILKTEKNYLNHSLCLSYENSVKS